MGRADSDVGTDVTPREHSKSRVSQHHIGRESLVDGHGSHLHLMRVRVLVKLPK